MRLLEFLILIIIATLSSTSRLEANLYKTLMKNYSTLVRPVRDPSKALNVTMKVFLQQILNVDEQNQVVEINAWLKLIWNDYRLRWRPVQYEDIGSVRFLGGQVWQPDVLLYNSADDHFDSTFKSNVVVYSSGEVNWVPPGIFKISCKIDITMFPFDEQICFMKFGSWTYHGFALNLQVDQGDEIEASMDLSTYIPNGEWRLLNTPVVREEKFYKCCPEPYPTIKFYIHIRRRALYYLFNIIIPSILISLMTLLAFCLPAHDMSEKIGFQTTILLSVCFFLTILSEMTPTTSEAVPLLGMFFSTVTLIVTITTTFTIAVLNIRYRQHGNHEMSNSFKRVFMEWIPWLVLMRRPKHRFRNGSSVKTSPAHVDCVQCARCRGDSVLTDGADLFLDQLDCDGCHLNLERKVGEGFLMPKLIENSRKDQIIRYEKCLQKSLEMLKLGEDEHAQMSLRLLEFYTSIASIVQRIRVIMDKRRKKKFDEEDWKFAAMALDRLCLIIFTLFLIVCLSNVLFISPYIDVAI